jgi:hypothetical protein
LITGSLNVSLLLLPLAQPGWGLLLAGISWASVAVAGRIFGNIASTYQQQAPDALRARVISAFALFGYLGAPPMALLAGASSTWLGPRATLAIAAIAYAVTPLILVFSPLRGARDLTDAERSVKAQTLNRLTTALGAVDARFSRVPVLAWQASKIPARNRLLGRLRAVRGEIESLSSEPGLDIERLGGLVSRTNQVVDDLNALLTSAPPRGPPSQASPRQPRAVETTAGRWALRLPRVFQDGPSCWPGSRRSPWPRSRPP